MLIDLECSKQRSQSHERNCCWQGDSSHGFCTVNVRYRQAQPASTHRVCTQDRDEVEDYGPEADGREDDVVDDAAIEQEEEGEGEDLLDDNMYECAPTTSRIVSSRGSESSMNA